MMKKALYLFLISLMVIGAGCHRKKATDAAQQPRQQEQQSDVPESVREEPSPLPEGGGGRFFTIRAENLAEYVSKGAEVIDVREPEELRDPELGAIEGARNIPLGSLYSYLEELDTETPYILVCRSGNRSMKAARMMVKEGFKYVYNLEGGMMAYRREFPARPDLDIKSGDDMPAMPSAPGFK